MIKAWVEVDNRVTSLLTCFTQFQEALVKYEETKDAFADVRENVNYAKESWAGDKANLERMLGKCPAESQTAVKGSMDHYQAQLDHKNVECEKETYTQMGVLTKDLDQAIASISPV